MNIKQAIDRVHQIDQKLDSIKRFVDAGHCAAGDIEVSSGTWAIKLNALFSAPERVALLEKERQRLESERAKLASVIDMANAALKGLMT